VLPIPKVSNPAGFSDFRPISLLPCLSKVCEVLMAGQMNGHIRSFGLLCPFQSGFRRHHSTTTAVLKVTEDIRLNLEDGQATVLVDFSPAFDMIAHDLMVCKMRASQRYSDGATALFGEYSTVRGI
jgi:Reverse transcriptase (RNA-dependent DNA polymerase)